MRIESLHFKNITEGWELSETKFDDLNLLVGVSGAGKTQILEAIRTVQGFSSNEITVEASWKITFILSQKKVVWSGKTGKRSINWSVPEPANSYRIDQIEVIEEKLSFGEKEIFERNASEIKIFDQRNIGLSQNQSILSLFKEIDEIKEINEGLQNIYTVQITDITDSLIDVDLFKNLREHLTLNHLEQIAKWKMPLLWRLFFLQEKNTKSLLKIKELFISTFPEVEDINIGVSQDYSSKDKLRFDLFFKVGNRNIQKSNISSGMLKTFVLLCQVELSVDGTVFLIDEFENSLGINCLDVVTDQLFGSRELQFIITSHHPYVINNIPMEYWKVVTRKGGVIQTHSAEELKLGHSKHKAFTELINSKEFRKGVAA